MLIHDDLGLMISFGDQANSFPPRAFHGIESDDQLRVQLQFVDVVNRIGLTDLVVLNQTHSDEGYVIDEAALTYYKPYAWEGDYLLTNLSGVGLAVATADCLPIIIYDPVQHALGVAHAGWAGSFKGIAVKLLADIQKRYATDLSEVQIFFGPSSHACCYEVQQDFIEKLNAFDYGQRVVEKRDDKFYFDLPRFNQLQLEAAGVPPQAFCLQYNPCTICSSQFCSYRRDGEHSQRHMTIACLKIPA